MRLTSRQALSQRQGQRNLCDKVSASTPLQVQGNWWGLCSVLSFVLQGSLFPWGARDSRLWTLDCEIRYIGIKIWTALPASFVTLDKLLNLSETQFLHLQNGLLITPAFRSVWKTVICEMCDTGLGTRQVLSYGSCDDFSPSSKATFLLWK